jgi:hypothetical protein
VCRTDLRYSGEYYAECSGEWYAGEYDSGK